MASQQQQQLIKAAAVADLPNTCVKTVDNTSSEFQIMRADRIPTPAAQQQQQQRCNTSEPHTDPYTQEGRMCPVLPLFQLASAPGLQNQVDLIPPNGNLVQAGSRGKNHPNLYDESEIHDVFER